MRIRAITLIQTIGITAISVWGSHAQEPAQRIVQRDERFHPNSILLNRGESLQVTNEDRFIHHVFVDSPEMKYDSGEQRPGRVLTIPFEKPGEYVLACAIHLKMKLRVRVAEK
jgi:plastocyanin